MTLDRDSQLKSLVDDITALLTSSSEGGDGVDSQFAGRTREVLGRAQAALSEAMAKDGAPVVQSVEAEIQRLREEALDPLRSDLDGLRQQQKSLSAEVAQLEQQRQYYQSLAQQQSNQSQILDDLVQPLGDRLESTVTEQVNRALTEYQREGGAGTPSQGQDQSNAVLEQLQSTLQTVFAALQTNTQRYESTLQSSMDRIQTLGEQSEAILEHWLERIRNTAGSRDTGTGVATGSGVLADRAIPSNAVDFGNVAGADLSETDPALAGVPYPGMDLPTAALAEEESVRNDGFDGVITRSAKSLGTDADDSDAGDFVDDSNPFALGGLDLTDLSAEPPMIATPSSADTDDIDFTDLDGVGLPDDQDGSELLDDGLEGIDEGAGLDISDPGAQLPLVEMDLEGASEVDEDEDEDATVIQYVNVDMLSRRREETFRMPDVLVNLSSDEGPRLAEDLTGGEENDDLQWQDDETATQYLDEDLSGLQNPDSEGSAEVAVNLAEPPEEDGADGGAGLPIGGIAAAAGIAAAGFTAASGGDGDDDGLFPVTPEAESPELAVVEETSGLDADPAALDEALDEALADVDVTTDVEGADEVEVELEGDRDERLMEEMMAIGVTDQIDEAIAGESDEALEALIGEERDEAAELAAVLPEETESLGDEEISLDDAVEDLVIDGGMAEDGDEVEMMEGLPTVDELMEEGTTARSLDGGGEVIDDALEDVDLGASDLDQLGIGSNEVDPFEGLEELSDEAISNETALDSADDGEVDEGDSRGIGLGMTGAAAAADFAAFSTGGGDTAEDTVTDEGDLDFGDEDGSVADEGDLGDLGADLDTGDLELGDLALDTADDASASEALVEGLGLDLESPEISEADSSGGLELDGELGEDLADLGLDLDGDVEGADGGDLDDSIASELEADELATDDLDIGGLGVDDVTTDIEGDLGDDLGDLGGGEIADLEMGVDAETIADSGDSAGDDLGELDGLDLAADEAEFDGGLGDELIVGGEADDGLGIDLDAGLDASDGGGVEDDLGLSLGEDQDDDLSLEMGEAAESGDGLDVDLGIDLDADDDLAGLELPESLPESADGEISNLLDEAVEAAAAIDLPGLDDGDGDLDDLGLEGLDEGDGDETVPVDLELEAVLGNSGEAAEGMIAEEAASGEDLGLDSDLDLSGLGDGSADEGEPLDLDELGLDVAADAEEDLGLGALGLDDADGEGTEVAATAEADLSEDLDLDLAGFGEESADEGDLDFDLGDLGQAGEGESGGDDLGLEGLSGADAELEEVLSGEAEAEAIASLDEALDLGDLSEETAASAESGSDDQDFDLDLLDSLADFSEESPPMAEVDAELDAFFEDALGPDADGVEKKKE
ncbi:MAG: hypothetical protein ACFCA4_00315 [Cyanophyceae cyanobacterium]